MVGLMLYNIEGDVYTLFKDEERNSWLDGSYRAQTVPRIYTIEQLETERDRYKYYLPVLSNGQVMGNLVITLDFTRYFSRVFAKYNLEQYQWQWVVNDTGAIIFDNHGGEVIYSGLKKITEDLEQGNSGRLAHGMEADGEGNEILSAYYPVNILGLTLAWSSRRPPTFSRSISSGTPSYWAF
ncbi:MAG: hypothetical protein U5L72_00725 [Bacteroidales bacterium]|nr:hypothetical protein [Bacteroidales bacterium]